MWQEAISAGMNDDFILSSSAFIKLFVYRYFEMKKHAAVKEQKTMDASEKVWNSIVSNVFH